MAEYQASFLPTPMFDDNYDKIDNIIEVLHSENCHNCHNCLSCQRQLGELILFLNVCVA